MDRQALRQDREGHTDRGHGHHARGHRHPGGGGVDLRDDRARGRKPGRRRRSGAARGPDRRAARQGKILCPFHDDHTPSLTIFPDHFHCFVCDAHGDAIDWLMLIEGMTRREAVQHIAAWDGPRVVPVEDDKEESRAYALRLWEEGVPIAGPLAARYFTEIRGIDLAALPTDVDRVLRFHPRCPFGPSIRHPCLLALMRTAAIDEPTGIHRIALTPEARKIDRRMLG